MKTMKKIMLIFILFIIGLMIRNAMTFDYIAYETTEEFIRYTQFNPEEIGRDFELLGVYELDIQVDFSEEAFQGFSEYIQNNYSRLSRTVGNNIQVVYDEINDGYYLYYEGFFFISDTFGFIYKGTNVLYYVIRI